MAIKAWTSPGGLKDLKKIISSQVPWPAGPHDWQVMATMCTLDGLNQLVVTACSDSKTATAYLPLLVLEALAANRSLPQYGSRVPEWPIVLMVTPLSDLGHSQVDEMSRLGIAAMALNVEIINTASLKNQDLLRKAEALIIIATVKFGMSVDVHNVKISINLGFSESAEAILQQNGRAGMDPNTDAYGITYIETSIVASITAEDRNTVRKNKLSNREGGLLGANKSKGSSKKAVTGAEGKSKLSGMLKRLHADTTLSSAEVGAPLSIPKDSPVQEEFLVLHIKLTREMREHAISSINNFQQQHWPLHKTAKAMNRQFNEEHARRKKESAAKGAKTRVVNAARRLKELASSENHPFVLSSN
ncbi:hypothetical protein HETIRDRAFT_428658 [Heterobasidion irregulare TC 32-1]|uniref:DNA 3'-5' helicase n=1 Tax=Heterobasidion irregulare (strain TC 32-1) TaxID=747525 RepID=W4JZA5_HETIT|nr:uncharacterized protein HETIRDRAFT_428658 [Heterobasidion irregulare TC 32-1]ETW78877.1 hypothetical protein HETIRDRAFT_428658 [Heterobasidion irregulare TC 32-1]